MNRMRLSVVCAVEDEAVIEAALRSVSDHPIHVVPIKVMGLDFADARISERVTARLNRLLVSVEAESAEMGRLVEAVGAARRKNPVRWELAPVVNAGRIA